MLVDIHYFVKMMGELEKKKTREKKNNNNNKERREEGSEGIIIKEK